MIKDRGMVKWMPAAFMPEQSSMMHEVWKDEERSPKPILDEYQIAEMESKIHYAMECNYFVTLTVWHDGFTEEYKLQVHYLDSINKRIRGKDKDGMISNINFDDVLDIKVHD